MILAVETSFDETAIALVEAGSGRALDHLYSSSAELHERFGGVVPELAARAHLTNLPPIARALKEKHSFNKIELVAATAGPGLPGCLLAGVGFARGLALGLSVPYSPINHLEGHLLSPFMEGSIYRQEGRNEQGEPMGAEEIPFPHLGLIVSGGHTELVMAEEVGNYRVLGRTRDDAVGELLDKLGNHLGLGYPAGAKLERLAHEFLASHQRLEEALESHPLPVPMRQVAGLDFSFSGLKTAAVRMVERRGMERVKEELPAFAAALLAACFLSLVERTRLALREHPVAVVGISGGVARNQILREMIARRLLEEGTVREVRFPSPRLCIDNATMVGYAAWLRRHTGRLLEDRDIIPRWRLEEL